MKEVAPSNISYILVTLEVFQFEMLPLKLVAPPNIQYIVVTDDISHEFIF